MSKRKRNLDRNKLDALFISRPDDKQGSFPMPCIALYIFRAICIGTSEYKRKKKKITVESIAGRMGLE
jgi:hypothetical protein